MTLQNRSQVDFLLIDGSKAKLLEWASKSFDNFPSIYPNEISSLELTENSLIIKVN